MKDFKKNNKNSKKSKGNKSKPKVKMFKDKFFLISFTFFSFMVLVLTGFLIKRNIIEKFVITTDLNIEIGSEKKVIDLLTEVYSNTTIINGDEIIDTSKFGEYTINITYQKNKGKKQNEPVTIKIIDTTKPKIDGVTDIKVMVGTNPDLLKDVSVTDNSGEELEVIAQGEFDYNTIGTYNIKYIATDASGNTAEIPSTITIQPFDVKRQGVYYWDDRNNDRTISFSEDGEIELKICRKWGENACSYKKGTFKVSGKKVSITYTHSKSSANGKWYRSYNQSQSLNIISDIKLETYSYGVKYIYNYLEI